MTPPQGAAVEASTDASPAARLPGVATGDVAFRLVLALTALAIPVLLGFLVWELLEGSQLAIGKFGLHFFVTSTWDPVAGQFGALPLIFGTLLSSFLALLFAVPLSLGVAIFLTEFAPLAIRRPIAFLIELLAAIPSVVYGLWGFYFLIPILRKTAFPFLKSSFGFLPLFQGPIYGSSMLAAGLILAIMVMPFVMSAGRGGVATLPGRRPAGGRPRPRCHPLGSGVDRGGAVRAVRARGSGDPGARPGAGRDDGRDDGDRQPARDRRFAPRPGLYDGRGDRQRVHRGGDRHALRRARLRGAVALRGDRRGERARPAPHLAGLGRAVERRGGTVRRALRRARSRIMVGVLALSVLLAVLPLLVILGTLAVKGAGSINLGFFTRMPVPAGETGGGVAHAIVGTLLIVGAACVIGLPMGIGAGIFAAEFAGSRLALVTRFVADVLNGTPSIVVGVFAWRWIVAPQHHFSGLAGSAALALLMIPMVMRTTEEMIKLVPHSLREAALALGYARWRTSLSIVVRTCLP